MVGESDHGLWINGTVSKSNFDLEVFKNDKVIILL